MLSPYKEGGASNVNHISAGTERRGRGEGRRGLQGSEGERGRGFGGGEGERGGDPPSLSGSAQLSSGGKGGLGGESVVSHHSSAVIGLPKQFIIVLLLLPRLSAASSAAAAAAVCDTWSIAQAIWVYGQVGVQCVLSVPHRQPWLCSTLSYQQA